MTLAERFDHIMTLIDTALDDPCPSPAYEDRAGPTGSGGNGTDGAAEVRTRPAVGVEHRRI